ncbi:D-alanyl-D-alanine carboxypeptidase/D-alanyl-D-alanine-endopeptidase [bacterium]|nr:D-alanyl-D-alanine carboxypeptidase/D-alanyl-D-alanine-endopeptidase [bacterium]
MQKIISIILSLCFTVSAANANNIDKTINDLNINKSAISVSIKDVQNGNTVYSLNENTPMVPASTLKLVTSSAALYTLGKDYQFSTKLYKSTNNDLYFKLGADPFLESSDLSKLLSVAKSKNIISPKQIYIDSTLFDDVEWGEGWQWDDDLNPLMPKFSIYNLDSNLLKLVVTPGANNSPATLTLKPFYPITFMNLVKTNRTSGQNHVSLSRNNSIAPNIINVSGTVAKSQTLKIPVNNTKMYFKLRLEDAIREQKLDYFKSLQEAKMPENNIYLVDEIKHDIQQALSAILKQSNNLVAESLFKIAGACWADSQGSTENSLAMLNEYLKTLNIKFDDIKIVDGSGVSKNNLMTADFMSDFLVKKATEADFELFKSALPIPGEGTLKNRMLYFKGNLSAKTGTLSDASAIAGYITSRKGKVYAFDIMINDAKTSSADKKNIEEQILRQIYITY